MEPTPRVIVDESVLTSNIARMAEFARGSGMALRPHVKTHKSVRIARLQLEAGAIGITVATIGEAEVFAAAGFADIFIAYPLWVDETGAARLRALERSARIRVGLASTAAVRRLAEAAPGTEVVIEVDSGHHRSGVQPADAGAIADLARDSGLDVAGVFTFPGHSYRPEDRGSAASEEARALALARDSLADRGFDVRVVSGGSTPSAAWSDWDVLTEFRPGVYVFNDSQQLSLQSCAPDQIALTVESTIVAVYPTHAIADAGSKALSTDNPGWTDGFGRIVGEPDARITALSEHHATIVGARFTEGERIRIVPNHVCNVVNLVDELWFGDERVPVDARGRNH